MSELTPDKELDAVHQIIISPQCSSSYITKLPIRLARPLCERLQLPLDSSGTRGSIKADYIAALKEYVSVVSPVQFYSNASLQTRNKHGPLEHGKGKRKAGELGEDEDGSNKTKRKKDTHSGMTTILNSTPEILPSVTTTASTKRPASPGDGESQEDSRIIKRMRLPGGPLLKLVRSKAPSADRIPTHSITRRSHKVTGAARPRKPESSQDTVRRDTSDKVRELPCGMHSWTSLCWRHCLLLSVYSQKQMSGITPGRWCSSHQQMGTSIYGK